MMSHDPPEDWTREEAEALRALAREPTPPPELEERVVRSLVNEGLLDRGRRGWRGARRWLAAAAGLVLAVGGYLVGYRSGTIDTVSFATTLQDASPEERAAFVQHTGSRHLAALAALGEIDVERTPEALEQGREAALVALYASTLELAKMDPDNAAVQRILRVLAATTGEQATGATQVVWF